VRERGSESISPSPSPARSPRQPVAPSPPLFPAPARSWFTATLAGLRWWFSVDLGWGLAVSTAVHLLLLGALSMYWFQRGTPSEIAIDAAFDLPGDGTELDLPGDSGLDDELSAAAATPVDFVNLAATVTANPDVLGSSDQILGALGGGADGEGTGFGGDGSGGMAGKIRVPSSAITKGSFTVWTDPEEPIPGRKYDIVIQVKVSSGITSYRLRDLTGTVRGTDGYFKAIKYESTKRAKVTDGVVQIRVPVPGAAQLIRDTIKIRSAILKEEQTIEIVFGGQGRKL
jgi:hypothetical protein